MQRHIIADLLSHANDSLQSQKDFKGAVFRFVEWCEFKRLSWYLFIAQLMGIETYFS